LYKITSPKHNGLHGKYHVYIISIMACLSHIMACPHVCHIPELLSHVLMSITYLSCYLLVCQWSVTNDESWLGDGWGSWTNLATFTQTNASQTQTLTF